MKEKKLFDAMSGIDDKFIVETTKAQKKQPTLKKAAIIAAAFALVVMGAVILPLSGIFSRDGDSVVYPKAYAFEDYDTKMKIKDENPIRDETINSANNFGYKSAAEILKGGKNANYSPISLFYALGVTASGAGGETQKEMLSALEIKDSMTLSKECGNLYRNLYFDNKIGTLRIANSLWINNGVNANSTFTDNAKNNFYASTHSLDLSKASAQKQISNWINSNTKGTLAPEIKTDVNTSLLILNTIYFKDQWSTKFEKDKTQDDTFTKSDGGKVTASFLNDKRSTEFYKGENFSRSSLGLQNGGKMVFVLPDEGTSTETFFKSKESLKNAFEGGESSTCKVNWKIPKFKFTASYNLENSLKSLGIQKAFYKTANFNAISNTQDTCISNVCQGSYISLNEEGVAASAYTDLFLCGSAPPPPDTKNMLLTRPFLYGIYSDNGTLLFIGIIENPT